MPAKIEKSAFLKEALNAEKFVKQKITDFHKSQIGGRWSRAEKKRAREKLNRCKQETEAEEEEKADSKLAAHSPRT